MTTINGLLIMCQALARNILYAILFNPFNHFLCSA